MAIKALVIICLTVTAALSQPTGVKFCELEVTEPEMNIIEPPGEKGAQGPPGAPGGPGTPGGGPRGAPGLPGAPGRRRTVPVDVITEADQKVKNSQVEKNARRILGKKSSNEFAATENLSGIAQNLIRRRAKRQVLDCGYGKANSQQCSNSPFREPTGRCTSLTTKTWGMAFTPYARVLPPKYQDGFNAHRTTQFFSNKPLLSARAISAAVTSTDVVLNDNGVSSHTMQWGQFISHEFTLIAPMTEDVACCPDLFQDKLCTQDNVKITNQILTDEQITFVMKEVRANRSDICIPIENRNDPVFGEYVCIHQDRSKIAPAHDCSAGPREQMNLITHVFDASAVYGSSEKEARDLRTFSDGMLKSQKVNGAILPPCKENAPPGCPFLAGDSRVDTTPNLSAYHAMWVVVHNKIADQLRSLNPLWNDERIYQETRRIVAGIMANIHFYEYLPIVVGRDLINKYRLGDYDGFDASVNPSILNELAGAAMRFGHSTINGQFSLIKDNMDDRFTDLEQAFFDTSIVQSGGVKQCVRGLTQDRPWITDRHFPTEMRNRLFRKQNDIVSLNINRGRDHGFASYVDYRRHYRLSVPTSWEDLHFSHPPDVVAALKSVYGSVNDIELYIGGVTENHGSDVLVGETFGNILADGFSRNRKGDRLFFESSQSGLSKAQIEAIKKYTLSNLLCDGSSIDSVSSQGFFRIDFNGAILTPCSSLPKFDLSLWKEGKVSTPPPTTTTNRPGPPVYRPYPTLPPCRPYGPRPCRRV